MAVDLVITCLVDPLDMSLSILILLGAIRLIRQIYYLILWMRNCTNTTCKIINRTLFKCGYSLHYTNLVDFYIEFLVIFIISYDLLDFFIAYNYSLVEDLALISQE